MDWRGSVDELLDGLEVIRAKDLDVLKVGDKESVGWWSWLC